MPGVPVGNDVTNTLVAVISALGILLVVVLTVAAKALGYAKVSAVQSAAVNRATNGVGPGEHRLYDMVAHIKEDMAHLTDAQEDFQARGWKHLPADIGDATALTLKIRQLESAVSTGTAQRAQLIADLAAVDKLIRAHDEWERSQKWQITELPKETHYE